MKTPLGLLDRRQAAFEKRVRAATIAKNRPIDFSQSMNNDEEASYDRTYIANYTKGLPHKGNGEVLASAYENLVDALANEASVPVDPSKPTLDTVGISGNLKLRNPLAGLAYDLEGPDSHHLVMRPAPRIDSDEGSAEMAELYWMALCRDVHFAEYESDPRTLAAAKSLSGYRDYRAPKNASGKIDGKLLFRGFTPGDLAGPYVSQFLLLDVPFGVHTTSQKQRTFDPGVDYMTGHTDWLLVQNGGAEQPGFYEDLLPKDPSKLRYIRNFRDLAAYVAVDGLYQAYLNALLIIQSLPRFFKLNPGLPYLSATNMDGFGTFGPPHIQALLTEVASRALKAAWYQKWFVHRRARPEEVAARLDRHLREGAYPEILPEVVADKELLAALRKHNGDGYLLPMAFRDGCPAHPAYPSGHATVAGACVTMLKFWFNEESEMPAPRMASADGSSLVFYPGADNKLTLGGELNKLAANIASARNGAGVHWRTDFTEGLRLGEQVAIGILEEQAETYAEPFTVQFTAFDGHTVTIKNPL